MQAFSGKCHEEFGNFDNISGKYDVKVGHFVNFTYIIFGQKCLAAPKLTDRAPTPMMLDTPPMVGLSDAVAIASAAAAAGRGDGELLETLRLTGHRHSGPLDIT